jgi:DNA-binding NtrC family response regulator
LNNSTRPKLLIVDDDALIADGLAYALREHFLVQTAEHRAAAMMLLRESRFAPDIALIDLGLPPMSNRPDEGFRLVTDLLSWSSTLPILVLSGQNEQSNAKRARALGATELIPKPCEPSHLRDRLLAALTHVNGSAQAQTSGATPALRHEDALNSGFSKRTIIGDSLPIIKLRGQIALYAAPIFPVLIEGESGCGKELVAVALHALSPRANAPRLALNCAAISPNLVEPTLFGYAKGAFTGAAQAKSGFFEDAENGTLFLDEIGELPLDIQPKLLRVLENGEFSRVGETQVRVAKARVVAATNRDLKAEVRAGRFRADLYHRLSVLSIAVPPLRELADDKHLLLDFFGQQIAKIHNAPRFSLSDAARSAWASYSFPGNVRELRNIVIRLTAVYGGREVNEAQLSEEFSLDMEQTSVNNDVNTAAIHKYADLITQTENFSLDAHLSKIELEFIDSAMTLAGGNMSQTAKLLGVSRTTLYSRLAVLRPVANNITP